MIKIEKDSSEKTYRYKFILDGKEVMMGDGYQKEEIFDFVKELLDSLVDKSDVRINIEVDDEGEDRSFIYRNKIEETPINDNLTTYGFKSNLDEIRPGKGFPGPQHQTEGWG